MIANSPCLGSKNEAVELTGVHAGSFDQAAPSTSHTTRYLHHSSRRRVPSLPTTMEEEIMDQKLIHPRPNSREVTLQLEFLPGLAMPDQQASSGALFTGCPKRLPPSTPSWHCHVVTTFSQPWGISGLAFPSLPGTCYLPGWHKVTEDWDKGVLERGDQC